MVKNSNTLETKPADAPALSSTIFARGLRLNPTLPKNWPQAWETKSNFILQGDCQIELGGPQHRSCLCVRLKKLASDEDGIWLFGDDLSDKCACADLAVLIDIDAHEISDELFYLITQNIGRFLLVKGVMVKASDGLIWLRVSRQAVADGLTLPSLGAVLRERLCKAFSEIDAIRIQFAVGSNSALAAFFEIGKDSREKLRSLKERVWKKRGVDFKDCSTLAHCGQCNDKKICANIRKIDRQIKNNRISIQEEKSK